MSSRNLLFDQTHLLLRGEVMVLGEDWKDRKLWVQTGKVWMTSTPADGDAILDSGDFVQLREGAPWVLQALEDAVLVRLSV